MHVDNKKRKWRQFATVSLEFMCQAIAKKLVDVCFKCDCTNSFFMLLFCCFRYVLGHEAMQKMAVSNILISGMKGLGVEIGIYYM